LKRWYINVQNTRKMSTYNFEPQKKEKRFIHAEPTLKPTLKRSSERDTKLKFKVPNDGFWTKDFPPKDLTPKASSFCNQCLIM